MPQTKHSPSPDVERARRRTLKLALACVISGVLALGLAGWTGWALHTSKHHDVTVLDVFTGKLEQLDLERTAGCVQGRNKRVCSVLLTPGTPMLKIGDTVRVAHARYKNSAGDGYDMLVVLTDSIR